MLNDFIPVINKLRVQDHPDGITIVPLSDAHYGSKEFNSVRWHKTIKRIYDDPHCFAVCVGDLLDMGVRNSITNVYEQTATPKQQKAWLIEELKPIAHRLLAAVGGNHEARQLREVDNDPLYDVMLALGREEVYRQNVCFMQTRFFRQNDHPRLSFTFAITHGAGGGQYIGSSANRVQNWGNSLEGVDCLITGHTHKPLTFPVSKIVFDPGAKKVLQRQFVVCVASSFLDYGGYPVQKLLPPAAYTMTEIKLTFAHDNRWKDIRVIQ